MAVTKFVVLCASAILSDIEQDFVKLILVSFTFFFFNLSDVSFEMLVEMLHNVRSKLCYKWSSWSGHGDKVFLLDGVLLGLVVAKVVNNPFVVPGTQNKLVAMLIRPSTVSDVELLLVTSSKNFVVDHGIGSRIFSARPKKIQFFSKQLVGVELGEFVSLFVSL